MNKKVLNLAILHRKRMDGLRRCKSMANWLIFKLVECHVLTFQKLGSLSEDVFCETSNFIIFMISFPAEKYQRLISLERNIKEKL